MNQGQSNRVLEVQELQEQDLRALFEDRCLALVVRGYYEEQSCLSLSRGVLSSQEVEPYTHEIQERGILSQKYFGVDRLGVPFNSTYGKNSQDSEVKNYFDSVDLATRRLRALAKPWTSPIDKLRLDLEEQCSSGAQVARFWGRRMLAGIVRVTRARLSHLSAEEPHFDALPEGIFALESQFAANIYLKTPSEGGELEIWDVPPLRAGQGAPEKWRAALPQPVVIKPRVGDLVLFCCRRPHAITAFCGEDRISAQIFLGVQKRGPLLLWN